MIRLALTGGIAVGKSTVAQQFAQQGATILNTDQMAHAWLRTAPVIAEILRAFPETVHNGVVDRQALGARVFSEPKALRWLDALLHPLIFRSLRQAFQQEAKHGTRVVAVEIPLLYETHTERWFDYAILVSAPAFLQRRRALARPGMTATKLSHILRNQLPTDAKRRQADAEIFTGLGRAASMRQVQQVLYDLDIA